MGYKKRIGNRDFVFEKTNLRISELWMQIAEYLDDYGEAPAEVEDVENDYKMAVLEAGKDMLARMRAKKVYLGRMKEIRQGLKANTNEAYKLRFEIIERLLVLNGYSYDEDFWKDKASDEDIDDILTEVVSGKNKKKAVGSST